MAEGLCAVPGGAPAAKTRAYGQNQGAGGRRLSETAARDRATRLYGRHELTGDFEVILDDGEKVTVAELLRNRDKYHERECHDPLEPDYRNDDRIGFIVLKDDKGRDHPRPIIYSHAHGEIKYSLLKRQAGYDVKAALKSLPEKAKADNGAPFDPDVLEDLATLEKQDKAAFESLMAALKKAGCRMGDLRAKIKEAAERLAKRGLRV